MMTKTDDVIGSWKLDYARFEIEILNELNSCTTFRSKIRRLPFVVLALQCLAAKLRFNFCFGWETSKSSLQFCPPFFMSY